MPNRLEVYKITNIANGKVYVGITNQGVISRWYKHCSDAHCKPSCALHNAICKYGKTAFKVETIEVIEGEDYDYLKEREIYWIKEFDSYNRDKGYNLTLGGDGTFGRFHSAETKDKIRQKALGREVSEETRAKMSESHQNRVYSEEELKIRSENGKRTRRPVLQFTLTMELVDYHESITAAAKAVDTDRRNISTCLSESRPDVNTSCGFIWRFAEQV